MIPKHRILFADDEPWLSEALRLSLESRGYECLSATTASDAWRRLEESHIDVVVTDIMMPGGDLFEGPEDSENIGFEFVRRIKSKWPKQAVICLSVIGDQEKIQELKHQGVLYIRKGETPLDTAVKLIVSKATGKVSFD